MLFNFQLVAKYLVLQWQLVSRTAFQHIHSYSISRLGNELAKIMSSWETRDSDFCLICLPLSAATYFWKCCYIHLFIIFQFDWYLVYSQNVFYAFIDCCCCWKWRVPDTWWIRKQIFAREIWIPYHPGAMPINKTCHHSFISAKHHCKRKYISTKHKNIGQFCPEYQVPRKVMILNIPNLWSNCYISMATKRSSFTGNNTFY